MQSPQPGPFAVPDASLRSQHRQSQQLAHSAGSPKARGLEECPLNDAVREVSPPRSRLPRAAPQTSTSLPMVRRTSRGCHPRKARSVGASLTKHHGCYFLDRFSGKGGVSRGFRKLGFRCYEFDVIHGPSFDLTKKTIVQQIRRGISRGEILGAMLAPPCSSFSVARDRAAVIRSRRFPWGLPLRFLSAIDKEKVAIGNACARSAISIIQALDSQGLPWCLENPHSSKIWYLPELQRLSQASHVQVCVVDFCQYNIRWKKPTRLMFGNLNLDLQDTERLQKRRCTGLKRAQPTCSSWAPLQMGSLSRFWPSPTRPASVVTWPTSWRLPTSRPALQRGGDLPLRVLRRRVGLDPLRSSL